MLRETFLALLAFVTACSSSRIPETRALAGGGDEPEISRVIEEALLADGRGQAADTLYAPHVTIVADGRLRRAPPRFAGVADQGELAITSTQVQSRGGTGWGDVEYRWVSDRSSRFQLGRASFVLTQAQGRRGWWIVQAHSSTVR
ncbi:MAG TPA: hypothetical protein VHH32_02665 [Gemmatimonadales bacterium]|nr:hypothetical protein [Gemmatimonadales bacterium]